MKEIKKWKWTVLWWEYELGVLLVNDEVKHDLPKPMMSLEISLSWKVKESR
jgi:hypothetical protein